MADKALTAYHETQCRAPAMRAQLHDPSPERPTWAKDTDQTQLYEINEHITSADKLELIHVGAVFNDQRVVRPTWADDRAGQISRVPDGSTVGTRPRDFHLAWRESGELVMETGTRRLCSFRQLRHGIAIGRSSHSVDPYLRVSVRFAIVGASLGDNGLAERPQDRVEEWMQAQKVLKSDMPWEYGADVGLCDPNSLPLAPHAYTSIEFRLLHKSPPNRHQTSYGALSPGALLKPELDSRVSNVNHIAPARSMRTVLGWGPDVTYPLSNHVQTNEARSLGQLASLGLEYEYPGERLDRDNLLTSGEISRHQGLKRWPSSTTNGTSTWRYGLSAIRAGAIRTRLWPDESHQPVDTTRKIDAAIGSDAKAQNDGVHNDCGGGTRANISEYIELYKYDVFKREIGTDEWREAGAVTATHICLEYTFHQAEWKRPNRSCKDKVKGDHRQ
ncbi:hypothetical protein B0J17DRAFT_755378 [Rhizoctonia solani]|nr:hypothetical protein B0J17DRAFT_755378 [Rhizoctonia solani]